MNNKSFITKREAVLLVSAALYNFLVYGGGRLLAQGHHHYLVSVPLDSMIPFLPWTILIYWGGSVLWVINYYLCIRGERGRQFIAAHFMAETVCFLAFVFLPTTMQRPEITGTSIFDWLVGLTFTVDAADNLLPSIHCFVSWLCWAGVRKDEKIPGWYKWVSFVVAAAICISTLTVKQHVIADVITGILLAEVSYLVAGVFFPGITGSTSKSNNSYKTY